MRLHVVQTAFVAYWGLGGVSVCNPPNGIWEIFSYLLIFPDCDQKFWKNQRSFKWSHAPSLSPWNYFAYTMLLLASMTRATIPFIALSMSKYSTSFLSTWLKGLLVLQEDIWTYTLFKVIKVKYYSLVQRIKTIISSKWAFLCQKWHMAVSVLNFLRDYFSEATDFFHFLKSKVKILLNQYAFHLILCGILI